MKKLQILVAIVALFTIQISFAGDEEVDQFSQLKEQSELSDSSTIINAKVNQAFDQGILKANKEGRCDGATDEEAGKARTALYDALQKELAATWRGNPIVRFIQNENTIPKSVTPVEKSIYANASMKAHKIDLAPLIQFKDTRIGTDKLIEFFSAGATRFRELRFYKTESDRHNRAERASLMAEKKGAAPILSWADHAAQMKGFDFWNEICGAPDEEAPAAEQEHFKKNGCFKGRMLTCEAGKWKRSPTAGKIDLAKYIDDRWDESINCSQYRDEVLDENITSINAANEAAGRKTIPPCPVDHKKCVVLAKAKDTNYLSPVCRDLAYEVKVGKTPTTDLRRFVNKDRHVSTYEIDKTRRPPVRGVVKEVEGKK